MNKTNPRICSSGDSEAGGGRLDLRSLCLDGVYVVAAAPHCSMAVCGCKEPLRDGLSALHLDAILDVLLRHSLRDQSDVAWECDSQCPTVMLESSITRACLCWET